LVLGGSTASGRRRQRRCAGRGVVAARERPGTRVGVGGRQGAGQVAWRGFPGSIWPRARGGRSPPAAYGRRRLKQSKPGERDGGRGSFAISENFRDLSVNKNYLLIGGLKWKSVEYHFCITFQDLQLLCYAKFHLKLTF
jgi:hypothetical protein